jgi:hypothetical protein
MVNKDLFYEIAGWYGTFAILGAYALVSFLIIPSDGILYQFLNLSGSIGLLLIALHKKVFQSVTVNVIWALIAVAAIAKLLL